MESVYKLSNKIFKKKSDMEMCIPDSIVSVYSFPRLNTHTYTRSRSHTYTYGFKYMMCVKCVCGGEACGICYEELWAVDVNSSRQKMFQGTE